MTVTGGIGDADEPRVEDLAGGRPWRRRRSRSRATSAASRADRDGETESNERIEAPPRDAMELPSVPGSIRRLGADGFRCVAAPLRTPRAEPVHPASSRRQEDRPTVTDLDYGRFEALTFDCYGTLIDWEAGILAGLRPVLRRARRDEPHRRRAARGVRRRRSGAGERPVPALPRDPRALPARGRRRLRASRRTSPRWRPSPIRSATGRRSPIRSMRCGGSTSASGSASSPTATTTCSRGRRRASRPTSTGS